MASGMDELPPCEFMIVKRSNSIIDPTTGSLFAPTPYRLEYDVDGVPGPVCSYDTILKLYKYKLRAQDRRWFGARVQVDLTIWGESATLMHEEVMLNERKEGAFLVFRPPNERNGAPVHTIECTIDKYGETEQFSILACSHTYRGQWFHLRVRAADDSMPATAIRIKTRTHAVKSKGGAKAAEDGAEVEEGAGSKRPKRRKVPAAPAEAAAGAASSRRRSPSVSPAEETPPEGRRTSLPPDLYARVAALDTGAATWVDPAAAAGWALPPLFVAQVASPATSASLEGGGGTPYLSDQPTPSLSDASVVSPPARAVVAPAPWVPLPLGLDPLPVFNPILPADALPLPPLPLPEPPVRRSPPAAVQLKVTASAPGKTSPSRAVGGSPSAPAAASSAVARRSSGGTTSVLSHLSWGEDVVDTPHISTPLHSYIFRKFDGIAELGNLHSQIIRGDLSRTQSGAASLTNSMRRKGPQFLTIPGASPADVKEEPGEGGEAVDPRREEIKRDLAEAMSDLEKLHLDDSASLEPGVAAPHAVLHPRTDIPAPFSMPPELERELLARVSQAETSGDTLTLASLLADPRILSTPLFRRRSGWLRCRRLLQTIRIASGSPAQAAVPPVSGVFLSLCATVVSSPTTFATPELAERACENCWNLLTVFTSDYPLASVDLFDCGWNEAMRLLNRAAAIAAEACKAWGGAPDGDAAGVLVVRAGARLALTLRQFGKHAEALSVLFEAWSTLLRLRVGPNRLESELLRDLTDCHVALGKLDMAEHFASRMYWFQESDDDRLFQATCIQTQGYLAFVSKRPKRAAALYSAACEVADALPDDDYRRMYCHRLYWARALSLAVSGKIMGAHKAFRRAAAIQRKHLDIASSDFDVIGWLGTSALESGRLADVTRHVYVVSVLLRTVDARADDPRTAHAMFHVGNFYALDRRWKKALQHYAKAEALYRASPAVAACFSPSHTRRRRLLQAVREVKLLAEGSPAAGASEEALVAAVRRAYCPFPQTAPAGAIAAPGALSPPPTVAAVAAIVASADSSAASVSLARPDSDASLASDAHVASGALVVS